MRKSAVRGLLLAMAARARILAAAAGSRATTTAATPAGVPRRTPAAAIDRFLLRPFVRPRIVASIPRGVGPTRDFGSGGGAASFASFAAFAASPSVPRRDDLCRDHGLRRGPRRHHPVRVPRRTRTASCANGADVGEFYANSDAFPDFASLGITSEVLLDRLARPPNSLSRPSAVQAACFGVLREGEGDAIVGAETGSGKTLAYLLPLVEDVLRRKREWKAAHPDGADAAMDPGYDYARAIVLVPNKELAHQAVRMAASICGGLERCVVWGAEALGLGSDSYSTASSSEHIPEEEVVRLAILPGGMSTPKDFPPFRFATSTSPKHARQPPPDLVFATPANLGPMALSPKNVALFADVRTLVVDEADMLLDGGYVRQLNNVLTGFRRADRLIPGVYELPKIFKRKKKAAVPREEEGGDEGDAADDEAGGAAVEGAGGDEGDAADDEAGGAAAEGAEGARGDETAAGSFGPKRTQHVFVAATIPDFGLRSVDAYLKRKFPNATDVTMAGMHNARHYGLASSSRTIWNELEENQDRMRRLADALKLDRDEEGVDGRGLKGEKVMVFLNTVADVDGATSGLRRAGIDAVPYHAKITLEERTSNLDRFRRYRAPPAEDGNDGAGDSDSDDAANEEDAVPVLVCTDVASRGLDVPGVTAIVQLQFAQNVVAHLHRMGRCGRAGNRDGRGIVFYGAKQRELVEVVREAEEGQARMTLAQDVEDDQEELGEDGEGAVEAGKVEKAFSRKRGFTKKRKKQRKRAMRGGEGAE
ncbi:hypothetical protein ACHAWF_005694 [Thalassiosira exigua]